MKTKIFCDIADLKNIKLYNKKIVDGFTTNPSLMRLAGANNYKNYCFKILKKYVKKNQFLLKFSQIMKKKCFIKLIKLINGLKNIYVKIPVVNSKGIFMGKVIRELSSKGIKLNITAVYTFEQTKKILNCLDKKTKSIISIFAGRMADKGKDPVPIFKKSISLTKRYKNIEILWASTREAYNYIQAKQLKCNIITMPPKVIDKVSSFGKSSKALTLDTVKGFLIDSNKSKFKI